MDELFDAIDQGVKSYLKYDQSGQLTEDSVNTFINKIGSIASYRKMSPINQKMHYIKGICRNRFHYWNDERGLAILRNYVDALRKYGWSEEQILNDLETEVSDVAKSAKNWSEWRQKMEGWTQSIAQWEKEMQTDSEVIEASLQLSEIIEISKEIISDFSNLIELSDFISTPFERKQFEPKILIESLHQYIINQIDTLEHNEDITKLKPDYSLCQKLHLYDAVENRNTELTWIIGEMYSDFIEKWMYDHLYLPSYYIENAKDALLFKQFFEELFQEHIKDKQF